jgi:hypothetical protein
MTGLLTRLADGWRRALEVPWLALVPMAFALLNTQKLLRAITFDGVHIGIQLGYPMSVVTTWQFVSVPNTGVAVYTGLPIEQAPVAVVTIPLLVVVQAVLSAGYFGSVRDTISDGSSSFWRHCRTYALPFLVLTVVPLLVLAPVGLTMIGAVGSGGGAGFAVFVAALAIVYFVAGYFLWATPYLIVLRDVGVVEAARTSAGFGLGGGAYARYTGGYMLFVVAVSLVATAVVVNLPGIGIILGILGGGIGGLAVNIATMRFVADIDPATTLPIEWVEL